MTTTKIQWAGHVWNPVVGCSIASHGCNGCYAMAMAHRLERIEIAHQADHGEPGGLQHYLGLTHKASRPGAKAVWTGKVASAPDAIWHQPLRRKKPTRYFVNSMGDLFHPDVPDEWRDRAFAIMALAQQHTFLVLTKRPDVMRDYVARFNNGDWIGNLLDLMDELQCNTARNGRYIHHGSSAFTGWPLPNVWLGVSTEDQAQADARIPPLLATPAAKRFISAEPLLGPVDLLTPMSIEDDCLPYHWMREEENWGCSPLIGRLAPWLDPTRQALDGGAQHIGSTPNWGKLDLVICGGESGPNARPMHPDWARSLRDQCALAGVPFFFKQWGAWAEVGHDEDGPKVTEVRTQRGRDMWQAKAKGITGFISADGRFFAHEDDIRGKARLMHRIGTKRAGNMLDGRQHLDLPQ